MRSKNCLSMALERSRKVGILGVPLGYGAGSTGSELGVSAMRLSRIRGHTLAEHISGLGYEVTDHGDVDIIRPAILNESGNPKHLAEMLASCENIISSLTPVLANYEFPVILGGDHSIAIGTFSAVAKHYR